MRNYQEVVALLVAGIVYATAAVFWEIAIGKTVWWWAVELLLLRSSLSALEAAGYTAVILFFVLVVIPHFVWFPVTLFRELKYLWDDATDTRHVLA